MSDPVIIPPTLQILCAAETSSLQCSQTYFWEALESDLTVPAITGTADIAVCNSNNYGVGACVWIAGAGFFKITARPSATSIRIQNNGHPSNVAPASSIGAGAIMVHTPPMEQIALDITVSDEDTDVVTVTIQARDSMNSSLAQQCVFEVWLSAAAGGALGTAPDGGAAATTGTVIAALTAATHLLCITDATGALVLEYTESGALTQYVSAHMNGKYVAGDQAAVWA